MISPDNYVAAAKILSNYGVQHCLSGASVPHLHGVDLQNHSVLRIVVVQKYFVAFHSNLGWYVIALQLANDVMNEKTIADFQSNFC